jgi:hypothetical protein
MNEVYNKNDRASYLWNITLFYDWRQQNVSMNKQSIEHFGSNWFLLTKLRVKQWVSL